MLIIVNVCNYKTDEWRGSNWIFLSQLLLIFPNAPNITENKSPQFPHPTELELQLFVLT